MKTTTTVKVLFLCGFVLLLLTGLCLLHFPRAEAPVPFESRTWKEMANFSPQNKRFTMVADLQTRYLILGADKAAIRELLGEPESVGQVATGGRWRSLEWYFLGYPHGGLFNHSFEELALAFEDGKLVAFGIVSD